MRTRRLFLLSLWVMGLDVISAYGQWLDGQCPVGVSPYIVDAMTSWDPDGAGPSSEVLVVGGWFNSAGGKPCDHIATWDGIYWQPLGAGLSGGYLVEALTVYNGQLIAGGNFTASYGVPMPGVARWDGSRWQAMGSETSYIRALIVFNGQLFAAGTYTVGGDTECVMRWDGDHWIPVSGNIFGGVLSLAVYNNSLVAGGNSDDHISVWDGGMGWTALGGGANSIVYVLGVWDNKLIAGGAFSRAGGNLCYNIAQWDGSSWQPVGGSTNDIVTGITTLGSDLYIAGDFTLAGDVECSHMARWNGTEWTPLGSGLDDRGESLYHVMALYSWNGGIYEGGADYIAGGVETSFISCWKNGKWSALGNGVYSNVNAFLADGGNLYAGGMARAGGVVCNSTARWDGQEWSAMGDGVENGVLSLVKFNGEILAGGSGWNAIDIVKWDGSQWGSFGSNVQFDDWYMPETQINTMFVHDSQLVAAGRFNKVNGNDCGNIAMWDGAAWDTMDGGVGNYDRIFAVNEYNGLLIAAGQFNTAGGVECNNIAAWDGDQWLPLGPGFDSSVSDITVYNGELIAAGYFSFAGSVECKGVAKWNGSQWSAMGSLQAEYPSGTALKVYKNKLYLGGSFGFDANGSYDNLAVWDGLQWQMLGGGFDGSIDALEVFGDDLMIGGSFSVVDGEPSAGWARWNDDSPTCGAWGYHPADVNLNCRVDMADFAILGQQWLDSSCIAPLWCAGGDIDKNGAVGMSDLLEMAGQWLSCTDPQNLTCTIAGSI